MQIILRYVQDTDSTLPIFRTETQRRLLVALISHPGQPRTLSELARSIGVDQTTAMREANRLLEGGLISERRIGRARVILLNEESPYTAPLRTIIQISLGGQTRPNISDEGPPAHRRHERDRHDHRPLPSSRR